VSDELKNNVEGIIIALVSYYPRLFTVFEETHEISVEMEFLTKLVGITVTLFTHIRDVLRSISIGTPAIPTDFFVIFLIPSSRMPR
jgi:hypothetical protein